MGVIALASENMVIDDKEMSNVSTVKTQAKLKRKKASKCASVGEIYRLEPLEIELLSEFGKETLYISINVEIKGQESVAILKKKSVVIRKAIVEVLVSKSVIELSNPRKQKILKEELLYVIDTILKRSRVKNIYFREYEIR